MYALYYFVRNMAVFCSSGPAKISERKKKTRQTEREVGRQYQGIDRPGVLQVLEGGGEQRKLEKIACEAIPWCPNHPRS